MSRLRTSRMLMGLLGVSVVAGATVFYYKASKDEHTETPVTLAKQGEAAPVTVKPDEPAPAPLMLAAVTTIKPATQPSEKPPAPPAVRPESPADPLATAKQQQEQGDLIAARKTLNDALLSGKLSAEQLADVKGRIGAINDTVIFSNKKFANDRFAETYTLKSGDRLAKLAGKHDITVELLRRMNNIKDDRKIQAGQTLKVISGPFNAVVDKQSFTIDLWLGPANESGSMFVRSYRIALGKEDSTPTGAWMVQLKQINPKFWGAGGLPPMEADDPKNPLGEYWIGLVGTDGAAVDAKGYGIHGTIEPDSIGKQASMGCIRLLNEEVGVVYELLCEGKSTVVVK